MRCKLSKGEEKRRPMTNLPNQTGPYLSIFHVCVFILTIIYLAFFLVSFSNRFTLPVFLLRPISARVRFFSSFVLPFSVALSPFPSQTRSTISPRIKPHTKTNIRWNACYKVQTQPIGFGYQKLSTYYGSFGFDNFSIQLRWTSAQSTAQWPTSAKTYASNDQNVCSV